jgi:hypothetical protein
MGVRGLCRGLGRTCFAGLVGEVFGDEGRGGDEERLVPEGGEFLTHGVEIELGFGRMT